MTFKQLDILSGQTGCFREFGNKIQIHPELLGQLFVPYEGVREIIKCELIRFFQASI